MTTNTVPPERPTSLGGVQSTVASDRSRLRTEAVVAASGFGLIAPLD